MYRFHFDDVNKAARIIYCFMTIPALTDSECTIWSDSRLPDTVMNDGTGFMPDRELCESVTSSHFAAISCVSSTDKADTRRVALNLMPDMDFMVLTFPFADAKLNKAEKRLLKLLEM